MDDYENNKQSYPGQVIFGSDSYNNNLSNTSNTPKIINIIIKYSGGLIKNEDQATYVVYSLIAIIFIISFFLLKKENNKTLQKNTSPLLIEAEQMIRNK